VCGEELNEKKVRFGTFDFAQIHPFCENCLTEFQGYLLGCAQYQHKRRHKIDEVFEILESFKEGLKAVNEHRPFPYLPKKEKVVFT
jgi:hypothetical protein